jgi:hypothetical protein
MTARRTLTALALAIFLCGLATAGEPAPKPTPPQQPADDSQGLLTLMDETDSADVFLTALEAMTASDPSCKGLLASAVRNAARLGILKGRVAGPATPEQDALDEALEQITSARRPAKPSAPAEPAGVVSVPLQSVGAFVPAAELLPMPTLTPACPTPSPTKRCSAECCPNEGGCDAKVIAELTAIVRETKSRDAFTAAVMGLCRFEDNSAMPAVIRHAERLGLLDGLAEGGEPTPAKQIISYYLMGSDGPDGPAEPGPSCLPPRTLPVIVGPLPAGPKPIPSRSAVSVPTVKSGVRQVAP